MKTRLALILRSVADRLAPPHPPHIAYDDTLTFNYDVKPHIVTGQTFNTGFEGGESSWTLRA